MKMRSKIGLIKIVIVILFLPNGLPASGQDDPLKGYLDEAGKNNRQLHAQYQRYLSVSEKVHQAGVLPDPQLDAGIFLRPMETMMGKQLASIKLMQMFPWFGTLGSARDEASHMARMESDLYRSLRRDIFFNVCKEYYGLYSLQKELDNTRSNLELLNIIEQSAIYRYETAISGQAGSGAGSSSPSPQAATAGSAAGTMGGMNMGTGAAAVTSGNTNTSMQMQAMPDMGMSTGSTMTDILRIQIEKADLENQLLTLSDRMETQVSRFNNLLNRTGPADIILPDTLAMAVIPLDEQSIADSMRRNNPMLQMYDTETSKNESALRMNRRMGMPMIGIGIEYVPVKPSSMAMPDMNGKDMIMPMISLSLPIYRGKYKAQQREISYMQQATDANRQQMTNNLLTELKEALQFYKDAARRVALYQKQQVFTEQNLNLLLSRYTVDGAGIDEVLRVKQQLLDYRIRLEQSVAETHIGKAWIDKLMLSND